MVQFVNLFVCLSSTAKMYLFKNYYIFFTVEILKGYY